MTILTPTRQYRVLPVMHYCESCTGYSTRPMTDYQGCEVCDTCLHLLETAPDEELILTHDMIQQLTAPVESNCSCSKTRRQFYQDHGCCEHCYFVGKEA